MIVIASAVLLGTLLLTASGSNITDLGRYLAWGLIGLSVVLIAIFPIGKRRFDLDLNRLIEGDATERARPNLPLQPTAEKRGG